jgi:hypothetical protein
MKDRNEKKILFDVGTSGKGEGEQRGWKTSNTVMYFVFVFENRSIKPTEIALRREVGKWREWQREWM